MAHPINDALNRLEGREAKPCTKECKYFLFPHLYQACVLSDVFSVCQGQMCYEFEPKKRMKNCIGYIGNKERISYRKFRID